MNIEKQYVDLVRNILENGIEKQPTRIENGKAVNVENSTIGLPHTMIQHDMSKGFPLMTHKKMAFKTMLVELEGFIKGITDKNWYKERGCKIWNEWCNPYAGGEFIDDAVSSELAINNDPSNPFTREDFIKLKKEYQKRCSDIGAVYGYQWRNFGQQYGTSESINGNKNINGLEKGFDQLKSICDKLRANPYDRRMVCSAWNPNQLDIMALHPCHALFNIVVYGDKLNLCWFQRSVDTMYGLPFNIASYATLLLLLCKHTEGYTNLKPGTLTGFLGDCHIYHNQIEGTKEMLKRELKPLPKLELTHSSDLFDWTHKDVKLTGYNPGDKINFGEITV